MKITDNDEQEKKKMIMTILMMETCRASTGRKSRYASRPVPLGKTPGPVEPITAWPLATTSADAEYLRYLCTRAQLRLNLNIGSLGFLLLYE
jgi:hypothetical protein